MSAIKPFTFHRPGLAESYCDSLGGQGLADSRSGLFLAAPRRTGKSTFLREDLLPAMKREEIPALTGLRFFAAFAIVKWPPESRQ